MQKFNKINLTITTALMAAAAATATARPVDVCNPTLPYTMTDLDQVRAPNGGGILGLPNNGTQYCVPTCTMDILAYLQNHGYPNLSAGPGPGPWLGSPAIYNAYTSDINSLGVLMNTDANDGTGGDDAFAGVTEWIDNAGYTGDIVVSMFGMNMNGAPELGDLAFCLIARCPVSISVGWYQYQGGTTYVRDGGHCVAVSRLPDYCSPFPKLSIRDPGTSIGSNTFSQGVGTTETYSVTPNFVITRRDSDDNSLVYQGPAVRIAGYASNGKTAIIDGYRAYFPAFGLSACNNPVNGSCVQQHIPNNTLTGGPQHSPISIPADHVVLDLAISANNLRTWILAQEPAALGGHVKVFDGRTGDSRSQPTDFPNLAPFNPRRICAGRDPRTLFLLDQNPHLVVKLDTTTGAATPMSLAAPATAICFDHQRNELVAFSSAARTVTRINPETGAPGTGKTLAAEVIVGPEPRISICPVGSYLWLTSGVNTGYGLVPGTGAASGQLTIAGTISDTQPLRGVDTNDKGHVFTTVGGLTAEFEPPAPGPVTVLAWARVSGVSPFAALADGPIFRIAKSNTNYDRAIHSQPEETRGELPDTFTASVPDCPADFNESGAVTVQDIFDFLAAYFAADVEADFNESGAVTVQDIFDFLAAYFRGC